MADSWWKGRLRNESNRAVWIIFDDDNGMQAKRLGPNRKTPDDVDADGVMGIWGFKIDGWDKVWKLDNGAEAKIVHPIPDDMAEVKPNKNLLSIQQTSWIGSLEKVEQSEFGEIQFDENDYNWGESL